MQHTSLPLHIDSLVKVSTLRWSQITLIACRNLISKFGGSSDSILSMAPYKWLRSVLAAGSSRAADWLAPALAAEAPGGWQAAALAAEAHCGWQAPALEAEAP